MEFIDIKQNFNLNTGIVKSYYRLARRKFNNKMFEEEQRIAQADFAEDLVYSDEVEVVDTSFIPIVTM